MCSDVFFCSLRRKDCPICGKRSLKRLANHLADVHELSIEERQPYFIRAKTTPVDYSWKQF